jgi:hypothetical protein
MAGDLYYSQVNSSLKKELLARSATGKLNRSPESIDFMLNKLTNVKIYAFEGDTVTTDPIGVLGGGLVTQNSENGYSYLPGGPSGYATNISTRPGPVITGVTVNIADQGEKGINTATINLTIMDPSQLVEIEDTFFRPGRPLKIEIVQPDDVIQNTESGTGALLNRDELLYTTKILQQQYKGTNQDLDEFRKMNQLIFTGLVDGFKVEYNVDATLNVTLTTRSIFGIYPDVSLFISNPQIPNSSIDQTITKTFSDTLKGDINNEVERLKKDYPDGFIQQFQILDQIKNETDRAMLYGPIYKSRDNQKYGYTTMISIGLLIDFLYKYIYLPAVDTKDNDSPIIVPNMQIVCDDRLCKTNYYEELVSANPSRILLYQGNTEESKTNDYIRQAGTGDGIEVTEGGLRIADSIDDLGNEETIATEDYVINYYDGIENIGNIPGFYQVSDKDQVNPTSESTKYGCLSRILINVETIAELESKLREQTTRPFTIKNFMIEISNEIKKQLGYAIFPGLIYHSESPSTLLFYDQNYFGPDLQIAEFEIPVFSSKSQGTVVRDIKLSYDVPDKYKNLLFGFRSQAVSPTKVASYNPYLISNSSKAREEEQEKWKENHEKSLTQLADAKSELTKDIYDKSYIDNLQNALELYVKYSEPSLQESIDQQKPRWLYTLEFTVDGINGFKFGDVLQFRGLPKKYNQDYVFIVDKITHKIDATGQWTTTLNCGTRARSTSII